MLDYMRQRAQSALIKVILGVIVVVFVLWGVGTFGDDQKTYAARINGAEVSLRDVQRTAARLEAFYRRLYGENFSPELLQTLDLKSRALYQLIDIELLCQEADRLGITVSNREVRDSIAGIEALSLDGLFQKDVYQRYVNAQGLTPSQFENEMRQGLLFEKFQRLLADSVRENEPFARKVFEWSNAKVNLAFIQIKAAPLASEISLDDVAVAEYYEAHQENFRKPEQLEIEYLQYRSQHFLDDIEILDDEVLQEYETFKEERYTLPEEIRARHILFRIPPEASEDTRTEIQVRGSLVLERLRQGEDFLVLAAEFSDDDSNKDNGGDLGFFGRGRMDETFEQAAFGIDEGETSDLVETRFGFHIIRVEEKHPLREQSLDEARESIVTMLRTQRSREAARNAAFDDSQNALAGKPLSEISEARGIDLATPPLFAANEPVVGLTGFSEIVEEAFQTPSGDIGPIAQGQEGFVLYRVTEIVESHVPPLDKILADVEEATRNQKATERARETAEALREQVTDLNSLQIVAEEEGIEVEETGGVTRRGAYVPKIGNVTELKDKIFALSPEAPVLAETTVAGGDAFVIVLKEHLPADRDEFEEKRDEIVERAVQAQQQAVMKKLLISLKKRAEIELNSSVLAGT
jgi:peptidyl-prolyl cis-trans isomerase D